MMDDYSLFLLPGCSKTQYPLKLHTNLCVCCLLKDVPFVKLTKCKHVEFFEHYFKFKLEYPETLVCYGCHKMLAEIYEFKKQVESSLMRLNGQLQIVHPNNTKLSKLTQSNTETCFIGDIEPIDIEVEPLDIDVKTMDIKEETIDIEVELLDIEPKTMDIKKEPIDIEVQSLDIETKTMDIKKEPIDIEVEPLDIEIMRPEIIETAEVEKEYASKSKSDVPLSSVGRNEKSELSNEVLLYKYGSKTYEISNFKCNDPAEKYEGKVRNVILSEAEVVEERKREAAKERYLKSPFKCENCITGFDQDVTLQEHLEKRHNEMYGKHICEICKTVHSTVESFRTHKRRHYKRFECVACGARYTGIRSARNHLSKLHGALALRLPCRECDYVAQSHRDYQYHLDKHKQKPSCDECGASFVNKNGLKRHMFTVHKKSNRTHPCTQCDKVYKTGAGLQLHVESAHTDAGAAGGAYCAACNTHFRTQQILKHHLNTHSRHVSDDSLKFACSECSARFLTKALLREHVDWKHLNSAQFECAHCHKTFKNSRNLKSHTRYMHENKRPPRDKVCDHCGRAFTTTTILRTHIRTHTGERPLRCAHCAATFAHAAALYTHNKLKHTPKE